MTHDDAPDLLGMRDRRINDPSANVIAILEAAMKRQDDLRMADAVHLRELITDRAEMAEMRANHQRELRNAEEKRIDAIRAVDVGAVNRAAEVAATQASTLASQVAVSAETLRTQVAAAAAASQTALAAALDPVQKDIADLRRAQYEAQGQKTQIVETRSGTGASAALVGTFAAVIFGLIGVAGVIAAILAR